MTLQSIWLLHHSHTDIGFTLDPPVLWEMQRRFIDTAIDAVERHADHDGDHAFKWVVETVAPLLHWLDRSNDRQIERFLALEKAGRIEVTGSFLNVTPLADTGDYIEMLQPLARLRRDYGMRVTHAMSADVNGHNWTLPDVYLDVGIETTSMAINTDFGGAPFMRPNIFRWQAPSGRTIPVLNNWCYPVAGWCGIPQAPEQLEVHVPRIEAALERVGWPFPFVLMQAMAYGGDNSTADIHYADFVRDWNERGGERPRLRMVTWREFWDAVRSRIEDMPVHAGDWTDFWNFGSLSSARETTVARRSRSRLRTADLLHACLEGLGIGNKDDASGADHPGRDARTLLRTAAAYRRDAWQNLETWHEHTWGSFSAAYQPELENSVSAWHHKTSLAWQSHSLSLLLARDGAAELAIRTTRAPEDTVVLFNPLPWDRTVWGDVVPAACTANPDEIHHRSADASATRHGQDIAVRPAWRLELVTVPACGYTAVPKRLLHETPWPWERRGTDTAVIEDAFRRILFDTEMGGITSWFDKTLGRELVDSGSDWRFGGVVHEAVAGHAGDPRRRLNGPAIYEFGQDGRFWHPDWQACRRSHAKLVSHVVYDWPEAVEVEQVVEVPGLASPATLTFILPKHAGTLEVRGRWNMGLVTDPESTYLSLPFSMPGATVRYDVGFQAVEPQRQQIPETCRDYFHLQNWVDFSGADFGLTIATPENPLAQFGDFHFAHDQRHFRLERALFLGWITSNYWCTNFPGYQPGQVTARYVLHPHAGGFDETAAHRFGLEAAMPCIPQNAREASRPVTPLPSSGSLLVLPDLPVHVLHALPAAWSGAGQVDGILLRLVNASDEPQAARIASGILRIRAAWCCDLLGTVASELPVKGGAVMLELPPRGFAVVRVQAVPDET